MKSTSFLLTLGLALAGVALPGTLPVAHAETVETRQASDVYATNRENSKVVARVRAGTEMLVLQRSGRWLKVRVSGRTGWVPRSILAAAEDSGEAKPRRQPFVEGRKSKRKKGGSAPRDRVGADAVEGEEGSLDEESDDAEDGDSKPRARTKDDDEGADESESDDDTSDSKADDDEAPADDEADDDEPDDKRRARAKDDDDESDDEESDDEKSDAKDDDASDTVVVVASKATLHALSNDRSKEVATVKEGASLEVLKRDGDWIKVKTEDGDVGWIETGDVEGGDGGDGGGGDGYRYAKLGWRLGAGLGYASLSQSFTSNSDDELGNYDVKAGALAIVLGGEAIYDYSPKYLIAGDLTYRFGRSSPGIRFEDVDTAYQTHDIDLGGAFGYKLSKKSGMAVYGRLGYHYGLFKIGDPGNATTNPARLPAEVFKGVVIGAHLDIPAMFPGWALHAGIDLMPVLASRVQTAGLEDGASSSSSAWWLSTRAIYAWKQRLLATAQLAYVRSSSSWSGVVDSERLSADASEAARTDSSFLVLLGLMRPF